MCLRNRDKLNLSAQTGTLTGILSSGDPIDNVFYHGGYDTYVTGTITLAPIPEPSSVLLLASGLVALAARRRRRG